MNNQKIKNSGFELTNQPTNHNFCLSNQYNNTTKPFGH